MLSSQNLDYCSGCCGRLPWSPSSWLKDWFPQDLGTLAADSLHLNSSGSSTPSPRVSPPPMFGQHWVERPGPHASIWTTLKGIPATELSVVLAKASVAIATTPLPPCHSRKHSPVNLWHASFLISLFPRESSPIYHSHCDYYMSGEKCLFYSLSLWSVGFICYSTSNFTFIQLLSSEKQTDLRN